MTRVDKFAAFMRENNNKSFVGANIPLIMQNLERADRDGRLHEFMMNDKEYRSAFPYVVSDGNIPAARGKDQVAIVFAMNMYGANNPGFVFRLNQTLKELTQGSSKQVQSVAVLMNAQLQLQELEISMINFVDAELLWLANEKMKKLKKSMTAHAIMLLVGGAMGMPGLAIAGVPLLSLVAMATFIYGFARLPYWLGMPVFKQEVFEKCVRPVGECWMDEEITAEM